MRINSIIPYKVFLDLGGHFATLGGSHRPVKTIGGYGSVVTFCNFYVTVTFANTFSMYQNYTAETMVMLVSYENNCLPLEHKILTFVVYF